MKQVQGEKFDKETESCSGSWRDHWPNIPPVMESRWWEGDIKHEGRKNRSGVLILLQRAFRQFRGKLV